MERKALTNLRLARVVTGLGKKRCDGTPSKPDSCSVRRGLARVMVPLLTQEFASLQTGTTAGSRGQEVGVP